MDTIESTYSITDIDLTAPLTKLRDANVDYIWMQGVDGNAAVAVANFNVLNFDDDVKFCFNEYVKANALIDLVKPAGAAEGFYIYRSETPWSDDSVAAQYYTDIYAHTGKTYEHEGVAGKWNDMRYMITLKYILDDAIAQIVDAEGWAGLTSEAVYQTLLTMISIDTKGNTGLFGYATNRRIGPISIKMARFTKTGTVSVSDDWIQLPRTFE